MVDASRFYRLDGCVYERLDSREDNSILNCVVKKTLIIQVQVLS